MDALASLRLLQRRTEVLLRYAQLLSPTAARLSATPWSPTESAARIAQVLVVADAHLRNLWGEQDHEPPGTHGPPTQNLPTPTAARIQVSDSADRLVRTITGATTEDWYRRRRGEGVGGAEVTWLALHDAIHHLEDAEMAIPRESPGPPEWDLDEDDSGDHAVIAMSSQALSRRRNARPSGKDSAARRNHPLFGA